jgi:SAM-dependent methyltransferase
MGVSFEKNGTLLIDSDEDPSAIRQFLRSYEPWRHKIDFTGGISTTDFRQKKLLNNNPLSKIMRVEELIGGFGAFRRALDVGSNAGYNSIYLAEKHGMHVVGIDYWDRHVAVSKRLAQLAGTRNCSFKQVDSESYIDDADFDLIIHFGTLYHLKNPILALQTALANLRSGGTLLIETQVYGAPEETRSAYIQNLHGDISNWWALGQAALVDILKMLGTDVEIIGDRYKLPVPDQYRIFVKAVKTDASKIKHRSRIQRCMQLLLGSDKSGLKFGPDDD